MHLFNPSSTLAPNARRASNDSIVLTPLNLFLVKHMAVLGFDTVYHNNEYIFNTKQAFYVILFFGKGGAFRP
jgi:hypothetical protein